MTGILEDMALRGREMQERRRKLSINDIRVNVVQYFLNTL